MLDCITFYYEQYARLWLLVKKGVVAVFAVKFQ